MSVWFMRLHLDRIKTQKEILILFILGTLTFCIAFGLSSPALLINDEWITVNQVNQLATGSQLIQSEGKYGRTFDNVESAYFSSRDSYLAYTLFLPVISLPAMYGIMGTGDLFRFILLVIWFILGISGLFACLWLIDRYDKKSNAYLIWVIIFLFFGLFLLNIYFYQPFESSFIDSPIESAAVILTNEILLALMTPMIYLIFRNLSLPIKLSLIGAISIICCSSYLIWSSSAKDHLLVVFLLTTIFWIFSSILHKDSKIKWFSLFTMGGLLCWARTEYGVIIVTGLLIWVLISILFFHKDGLQQKIQITKSMLIPGLIGLIVGLVPFFLNNYLITGNPVIPPQYLYFTTGRGTLSSVLGANTTVTPNILIKGITFIHQIINFYSPNFNDLFVDISGLLFNPENNGVGILFICPILLPALLYAIINYPAIRKNYSNNIRLMLLFSGFIVTITILGYFRILHGSTVFSGSLPDMRYFSPVYLPLGIISILLLSPLIKSSAQYFLRYILIGTLFGVPLLVIFTIVYLSHGISFEAYVNLYMRILLVILILIFGIAAWNRKIWYSQKLFPILYATLIIVPSTFQFFFVVVNALSKMNGYLYWQPVLQYLFTHVIIVMG